jgi:hypothetical protein
MADGRGLEGSCPVCRLGDVEKASGVATIMKCNHCTAEFCIRCGGLVRCSQPTKNALPCNCPKEGEKRGGPRRKK